MRRFLFGAVLTACTAGVITAEQPVQRCEVDHRCQALKNFFLRYESPLEKLSLIFIQAADRHRLDWRLLPAISMVETSGGKHGTTHNVFGWNSGRTRFQSVEAGILFVASRFAESPIYAGRSAVEILQKYNPARRIYPPRVTKFMMELSGEPVR